MIRHSQPGLIQGTLDMLILKTLAKAPMHGYAIAVAVEARSNNELRVEEGALYPALHRLELAGFLKSEWRLSEMNRRAKFYRLTAVGRKHLGAESANWHRLVAAVARVMEVA
jgi:PadR family transcriptional regulator